VIAIGLLVNVSPFLEAKGLSKEGSITPNLNNYSCLDTCSDFQPKRKFIRTTKILQGVKFFISMSLLVYIIVQNEIRGWALALLWFIAILVILIGAVQVLLIQMGKVQFLWDDMDYTGLIKKDLPFKSEDGIDLFAYVYFPEDYDFSVPVGQDKRPAIIGIHGFQGHHRRMDRYCLPSARKWNYLYFTYDARGHGQSKGDKNNLNQAKETKDFIKLVKSLPYVESSRIGVVGMSMGAVKAAASAYNDPDVKVLVMLSGPYDLKLTYDRLTKFFKYVLKGLGYRLFSDEKTLTQYSAMSYFKPDGIVLTGNDTITPNSDRVFVAACLDDDFVDAENTKRVIKLLNLGPKNYRLFRSGKHMMAGNGWQLSVDILDFITTRL
jgi:esterase/lipase